MCGHLTALSFADPSAAEACVGELSGHTAFYFLDRPFRVAREMAYQGRTFAHSMFACGSMVLYVYSVSVLRPAGRKTDTQRIELHRQAKVLAG
jgi:hypothetical protein